MILRRIIDFIQAAHNSIEITFPENKENSFPTNWYLIIFLFSWIIEHQNLHNNVFTPRIFKSTDKAYYFVEIMLQKDNPSKLLSPVVSYLLPSVWHPSAILSLPHPFATFLLSILFSLLISLGFFSKEIFKTSPPILLEYSF